MNGLNNVSLIIFFAFFSCLLVVNADDKYTDWSDWSVVKCTGGTDVCEIKKQYRGVR